MSVSDGLMKGGTEGSVDDREKLTSEHVLESYKHFSWNPESASTQTCPLIIAGLL